MSLRQTKVTAGLVLMTKQQYVAIDEYSAMAHIGTLDEILDVISDQSDEVSTHTFYELGDKVETKLELVLDC